LRLRKKTEKGERYNYTGVLTRNQTTTLCVNQKTKSLLRQGVGIYQIMNCKYISKHKLVRLLVEVYMKTNKHREPNKNLIKSTKQVKSKEAKKTNLVISKDTLARINVACGLYQYITGVKVSKHKIIRLLVEKYIESNKNNIDKYI